MSRTVVILALGLATMAILNAGQIQIGGVNGLTSGYVCGATALSVCQAPNGKLNAPPPIGNTAFTRTSGYSEQNYNTVLFAGASASGSPVPLPYATYSETAAHQGTISDTSNGVSFSMINDSVTGGFSNNVWVGAAAQGGNPTIEIPIGIFGVTDVWTMMNSLAATPDTRNAWIAFDFNPTDATATTNLTTVIVRLNGTHNNTTAFGQIRNAVDCAPMPACYNGANGPTSPSDLPFDTARLENATLTSGPAVSQSAKGTVNVLTNQLYSHAYDTSNGFGTSGTAVLDDQGFIFSGTTLATSLSSYLVDIRILNATTSQTASLGLSAITVDTVPEPSTVLLILTGLSTFGFYRLRRQ